MLDAEIDITYLLIIIFIINSLKQLNIDYLCKVVFLFQQALNNNY